MPRLTKTAKMGAVIFAKDVEKVANFYQSLLSMKITERDGKDFIELKSSGIELVIHAIPARVAMTIDIEVPPQRRTETPLKLLFYVASIANARKMAPVVGGKLSGVKSEWSARGFCACDGYDPEGNIVQFREILTEES